MAPLIYGTKEILNPRSNTIKKKKQHLKPFIKDAENAKITQVNELKIPSLGMDVAQLAARGKRASGAGCVTEGRLGSGEGGTSSKRRAENQERDDEMCESYDGCCLEDVLGRFVFADGGWSRTGTQTCCPDCAVRVRLCLQPGGQVGAGRCFC